MNPRTAQTRYKTRLNDIPFEACVFINSAVSKDEVDSFYFVTGDDWFEV